MIDAAEIRRAMARTWADPEYATLFEVGERTGGNGRRADAIIMGLWPSRGLELHGVEIKVSRHDWKREAVDPAKAEAISQYCDRWYVHTAPGVVGDLVEVPPTWGLREWDGKRWRTVREAPRLDARPISRQFLAALLRKADKRNSFDLAKELDELMAAERKQMDEAIQRRVEARSKDYDRLRALLVEVAEALGVEEHSERALRDYLVVNTDLVRVARVAGAITRSGLAGGWSSLGRKAEAIRTAAKQAAEMADKLDAEIEALGLANVDEDLAATLGRTRR